MNEKCPRETVTVVKDTVIYKEKVVIKDSIIRITLPSDTVKIVKYLYVDANKLIQMDTIIVEQGIVGAMTWVTNSKLEVIAYVTDSTMFYELKNARIEIEKLYAEKSNKETETTRDIVRNSGFARFCIWWFFICIAFIAAYVFYKINPLKL
jgi:hypothetical protein